MPELKDTDTRIRNFVNQVAGERPAPDLAAQIKREAGYPGARAPGLGSAWLKRLGAAAALLAAGAGALLVVGMNVHTSPSLGPAKPPAPTATLDPDMHSFGAALTYDQTKSLLDDLIPQNAGLGSCLLADPKSDEAKHCPVSARLRQRQDQLSAAAAVQHGKYDAVERSDLQISGARSQAAWTSQIDGWTVQAHFVTVNRFGAQRPWMDLAMIFVVERGEIVLDDARCVGGDAATSLYQGGIPVPNCG